MATTTRKKQTSRKWLTEQAVNIFLNYYVSFDWMKDYLLETLAIRNVNRYDQFEKDLLFCRKSFITMFPTAVGIATLFAMLSENNPQSSDTTKLDYCDQTRYLLDFHRRAAQANQARHFKLSTLWKMLTLKNLYTASAWSLYARVKLEESRIMGYEDDMIYWKEVKDASEKTNGRFYSMTYEKGIFYWNKVKVASENTIAGSERRILSISKLIENITNEEESMKDYKYQEEQAVLSGNKELAAVLSQIKHSQNVNLRCAAWCLTKASLPDHQTPLIWKAAAHHFMKVDNNENPLKNKEIASNLVTLAKTANREIQVLTHGSRVFSNKGRAVAHVNLEIALLWNEAAIHFEKKAKYLRNAMIIENEDYGNIKEKIISLRDKINELNTPLNPSFQAVIKDSCIYLEQASSLSQLAPKLLENGYTETSKLLLEQIRLYREDVVRSFRSTEMKNRSCWESELLSTSNKTKAIDFVALHRNFEQWKAYLEKIIKYARKNLLRNLVPLSDAQILKPLATFLLRYSADELIDFDIYSMILVDYSKAIDYGMEAQKREIKGEKEAAKLYRMIENYRQGSAECREIEFENVGKENNSDWKENLAEAIKTIQSAENIIQMTITTEFDVTDSIIKAGKFHEAAKLFILAVKSQDDRNMMYSKAAESLKAAATLQVNNFDHLHVQIILFSYNNS